MDILFFSLLTNLLYYCTGKLFIQQKNFDFIGQFNIYFFGIAAISFLALILNFFVKLSPAINSIIYLIIILLFFFKYRLNIKKTEINFLIISTIITFILIIFSKINRPDAGLYHLPFISIINDYKIIFGLNNLHFRFGHTSILQYLSAINNNYLFKENGISIPLASLVSFFYIYFSYDVWSVFKKKDQVNIGKIFSLIILIYITFKITRYSSFGNDAVPHLIFFYLISYVLKNNIREINFSKLLLISIFIFINKPTLGLVFIIPGIIFFMKKNIFSIKLLKIFFSFPIILLYVWIIKNIIISGCAIYPMKITCVLDLPWTNEMQINKVYTESEAWSKGWPDRKNKNIEMKEFNENFNWINAWSNKHLKYILKIILPFLFILFIINTFLINQKSKSTIEKDKEADKRFYILIITCFFGVISFFLIFPIYRYGYSFLISFMALISIFFIKKYKFTDKSRSLFKVIFFICIFLFVAKQSQKIYKNSHNDIWPNIYTLNQNGKINQYDKKRIGNDFVYYQAISGDNLCMYLNSPCTSYHLQKNLNHKSILGYSFLTIN